MSILPSATTISDSVMYCVMHLSISDCTTLISCHVTVLICEFEDEDAFGTADAAETNSGAAAAAGDEEDAEALIWFIYYFRGSRWSLIITIPLLDYLFTKAKAWPIMGGEADPGWPNHVWSASGVY